MATLRSSSTGLTVQQEAFVHMYFTTKNGTQSYLEVYDCNYETARKECQKLLRMPAVKEYLEYLMQTVRNDRILTAEQVLVGLSDTAKGDDAKLPRHQKIYGKEKVKALELLAKHHQLLTEVTKAEVTHKVQFVDDLSDDMGGDDSGNQ